MGAFSNARCSACGYTAGLTLGGTRRGHLEDYSWPASCSDCNTVSSVNIRKHPLKCENCGSENVTALGNSEAEIFPEDELRSGVYVCPHCKAHTLRISAPTLLFD